MFPILPTNFTTPSSNLNFATRPLTLPSSLTNPALQNELSGKIRKVPRYTQTIKNSIQTQPDVSGQFVRLTARPVRIWVLRVHVTAVVTGVSLAYLLTKRIESTTLRSGRGQVGTELIRWKSARSAYVLHNEAVRSASFSLQNFHGVLDSCQVCKDELTLRRLDPYSAQWTPAEMDSSP